MRRVVRAGLFIGILVALVVVCGCGAPSSQSCGYSFVVTVSPASATVNHAATPPGNQVQFIGTAVPTAPPGCPIPAVEALVYATWSNPDPTDIQISSADNSTNGTAVCMSSTNGAVTLTGTFSSVPGNAGNITKSVQLTCE